jgi:hypothetical protein
MHSRIRDKLLASLYKEAVVNQNILESRIALPGKLQNAMPINHEKKQRTTRYW